jgi:hypothetical protein
MGRRLAFAVTGEIVLSDAAAPRVDLEIDCAVAGFRAGSSILVGF